jgi:hypothetical protein
VFVKSRHKATSALGSLKEEENIGEISIAMSFIHYNCIEEMMGKYLTGYLARMDRHEKCRNVLVENSEGKRVSLEIWA